MQSPGSRVRHLRPARAIHFPSEAEVPETKLHLQLRTALFMILTHELAARARIGSDQFVYWNAKDPRRCLAPDVFVKLGGPDERFDSWKTWVRGTPEVAVEILSENEAWEEKLDRYHELGVRELVSYDAEVARIRVWDRVDDDLVERVVEGVTPCLTLEAFWVVALGEDGQRSLRLARDVAGLDLWPTPVEAVQKAAETRIAELEAKLRRG
jgi:Uma2 family endonuclease